MRMAIARAIGLPREIVMATRAKASSQSETPLVMRLGDPGTTEVAAFGGKNASLAQLAQHRGALGIAVVDGFATTAGAYRSFLQQNGLPERIAGILKKHKAGDLPLADAGAAIRRAILRGQFSDRLTHEIISAYRSLCRREKRRNADVAVRSSATAEDLPTASFAGQLESFLNIRGEASLLKAVKRCFASAFTDRAISYRAAQGFDHMAVAVSVGVQRMVRSDKGGAGVMFTIDTETGFPNVVLINAAFGLGEYVVKGIVDPDQYLVFKPLLGRKKKVPIIDRKCGTKEKRLIYGASGSAPTQAKRNSAAERQSLVLSGEEILRLARWGVAIEDHYGRPMDIEWAKDGVSGRLFIVQARPETVESRKDAASLRTYTIATKAKPLLRGLAIGSAVAQGRVCRLANLNEASKFRDGAVLVANQTDPDWGPLMKRAAAIVTAHGGRTSHAAIVSREIGLPAIVGATGAMRLLQDGAEVTVSCAQGDEGLVYAGRVPFSARDLPLEKIPQTRTHVMLNMADPAAALRWWRLPADGIGLARMEFIVSNHIKIHPMALAHFDTVKDPQARAKITALTRGYADKSQYFVDHLAQGIARLAASRYPAPVVVRMSDFKTNEYAKLIGGAQFEPEEPNPMIGWRGASRYYSEGYRDGFALECRAIRKVREEMGLRNVVVMIPFCRTLAEADRVLAEMAHNGLKRHQNGLHVYVMCEIPSNVILAKDFARRFDGFSIGSNDLTQLVLGVDRDSARLKALFDEDDPAVKTMIRDVIRSAGDCGALVGLCGQAPSDRPDYARFLVDCGIDSISVTPDSFMTVKEHIAQAEAAKRSSWSGSRRTRPRRTDGLRAIRQRSRRAARNRS
jgi:pyruvate,water dikinase